MKNFKYKSFVLVMIAFTIFFGFSLNVMAQPANGANAADQLIKIGDSIGTGLKALESNNTLRSMGLGILQILMFGNFVWILIKGMSTGRMLDALIGDLVPLIVAGFLALLFINGIDGKTADLGSVVRGSLDAITSAVAPANSNTSSLGQLIMLPMNQLFKVITDLMKELNPADFSIGLTDVFTGAAFSTLIGAFIKLIVVICIVILLLIAGGVFIGTLVMTQITFTIAIIFMPLFVPFMVFKPTAGLFDTWLKFFLVAGFAKIIGVLMLGITEIVLKSMVDVASALDVQALTGLDAIAFSIVQYGALVLMAALMVLMMGSVKAIASGLIGSVGVGFSGWAELNRGAMSQGPMGGMGAKPASSPSGGMGAGSTSSPSAHGLSSASQYAPNALKGMINTAGKAGSAAQGKIMASRDTASANSQRGNFVGPQQQGKDSGGSVAPRDMSNMSAATKNAYTKHIEGVNRLQAAEGKSNYTIPANRSSTTPPKSNA
ncbi:MAG: type IV secretion system protein [Rhodoferax sp.]|nr:type IV secretion system protein [Rhodoferax sp.]